MQVRTLGQEDPWEEKMVTHSSILAWRTPWTEEPGGLQSMQLQRVGHIWAQAPHFFTHPAVTDISPYMTTAIHFACKATYTNLC